MPGLAETLARGESYTRLLLDGRVYVGERDILELNPGDPATVTALQNTVERNKMIDSFIEQLNLLDYTEDTVPCPECKRDGMTPVEDGKRLACPGCGHLTEAA